MFRWVASFLCVTFVLSFFSPIYAKQGPHGDGKNVPEWEFSGVWGMFDRQSVQRGYQVYREVCSNCHSMKRVAFRNLREIGFTDEEVKSIASSYSINDGPDESGNMFERPGIPSDYFPSPFPNKEAAAAANNGGYPQDLSLMVKARHKGATYIYALLTGYKGTEADENGLYTNEAFPGNKLAMPPPISEGIVSYMDGTPPTVENIARDVVNFLQWAAEPEMEQRKRLGIKVITSLIAGTLLVIIINTRLWNNLRK